MPAYVAKPIRVLIPDYFAYELCAALAKPAKRLVDVVHGEHGAEVAQNVQWGVAVIHDRYDIVFTTDPALGRPGLLQ